MIHLGDCLDILPTLSDQSIDLVVTSPPYDNLRNYNNSLEWNFDIFSKIAILLNKVLKDGGVIVWIVNDATIKGSETGTSFKQALYFKDECKLNLHDTMIWQKETFTAVGSVKIRYAPVFEYMFIFSKGKPKTTNIIKDRKNKHYNKKIHGTVRLPDGNFKDVSSNGCLIKEYGCRFNVWNINSEKNNKTNHPAVFPEKLINDHVISWSNENETILDPFMGSGTTGVACQNTNRKFIGIEKDKTYFEIAKKRLANTI